MMISAEERQYLIEWGCLVSGAIAGLALAWVLVGFGWSFPGELEGARKVGIVSLTTLSGYAKSRDLVAYLFTLGLPAAGAILLWLVGRGSSDLGSKTLTGGFDTPTRGMWLVVVSSLLVAGFFGWHIPAMLRPGWNPYAGAWLFLGEQGATLAWVQSISSGGVYGRDFFSLYGPMFIYPLAWLMDCLGHNVLVERVYKLMLDIAACGLLGFVLARTLRARWLALVVVALVYMSSPTVRSLSANNTILRIVLGLVPVACVALWLDTRGKFLFVAGGLLLGQSLLFSHEAGFCAVLAIAVMLIVDNMDREKAVRAMFRMSVTFFAVVLVSLAPMVVFLVLNGAGPGLLDSVVGYPKTVMLGFGGCPFPSLRDWLGGDFRANWLHFAVIGVYCATLVALCVAWLRGVRSARFLWALGLLIYGMLLFRIALGRSGYYGTTKVMIPAIVLSALWIDELWAKWRQNDAMRARRAMIVVALTAVLVNLTNGICLNPFVRSNIAVAWEYAFSIEGKFSAAHISGFTLPEVPRLGIFVDRTTAVSLREIKCFLDVNTRPRDYVYFFPNEAIYYFLFDRTNPTRYPIAYFATAYDRQHEVIRDLEKNRPRYVIYSRKTWRVDGIPEKIQIPEIVSYLDSRYRTVKHMEMIDALERIPAQ